MWGINYYRAKFQELIIQRYKLDRCGVNLKLTLTLLIIILVVVVAGWLLYASYVPKGEQIQQESGQDSTVDSTATIEADLNQVPDDSAVNGDIESLDASIQAF